MRKVFLLFLFFIPVSFFAIDTVFRLDSLPLHTPAARTAYGLRLPETWKFHQGDDTAWASPAFNDEAWPLMSTFIRSEQDDHNFGDIGWFRLWIDVGPALAGKSLALMMKQTGASDIYLDGKKIHSFGTIDLRNKDAHQNFNPQDVPVDILFGSAGRHLLAVRYANPEHIRLFERTGDGSQGFSILLGHMRQASFSVFSGSNITTAIFMFYFTFFLALSFLHFVFYLFYRSNRSNLYYSIFAGAFGAIFLCITIQSGFTDPDFVRDTNLFMTNLNDIYSPALLAMLYSIFMGRIPKVFWLWVLVYVVELVCTFIDVDVPGLVFLTSGLVIVESLRIIVVAIIRKKEGAWIIGVGILVMIVFFVTFLVLANMGIINFNFDGWAALLFGIVAIYGTLSIPISMTIYLARDFAKTSRNLAKKLREVEELSARTLEQEKEKQRILEGQKELLEQKVTERTLEITEQKKIIEEKNKDITDSITYAKRIQEAMLPPFEFITAHLPDNFVLYKPKDIVAGDFYWSEVVTTSNRRQQAAGQATRDARGERISESGTADSEKTVFIAAADCTGHGVPGAMVSVVCANALNRAVKEFGITEPGLILDKVREMVLETFEKSQSQLKDGMDISLLGITNKKDGTFSVQWAGANNPFWYIAQGRFGEIVAHKQPIGRTDAPSPFPTHTITLNKGDLLFLFTDGFADQFGGPKGKKFKYKQLLDLLCSSANVPMKELHDTLERTFEQWRGGLEQVDDVCVIGIRL